MRTVSNIWKHDAGNHGYDENFEPHWNVVQNNGK